MDERMVALIRSLKSASHEHKAPIWKDIALRLERPARLHAEVNVSKLERHGLEHEIIVVPGKLLGAGDLSKKLIVAAYRASKSAREKIEKAGGRVISMDDLIAGNPKGSGDYEFLA